MTRWLASRRRAVTALLAVLALSMVLFAGLGEPARGHASKSPRSELIAFLRSSVSSPFDFHVFVVRADGSGERQLTTGPGSDYDFDWSPDGHHIVFTRSIVKPGRDTYDLYVVNADGTGLRQLTGSAVAATDVIWQREPAWSPDGRRIAFAASGVVDGKRQAGVYVMNADGSAKRRVDRRPSYNRPGSPAWSPDGRRLAFATAGGVIFVVNADGTGQRRLSHPDNLPYGFYLPSWSPDGRSVAFVTMPGHYDSIYVVDVASGRERRVTKHAYTEGGFAWHRDGRGLFYARERGGGVYSVSLDGTGDRRLSVIAPRRDLLGGLSLSRNGKRIVYASEATGRGDLYVMNRDGTGRRRLTNTAESDGAPSWSP
jgi:TolB protein